MSMKLFWWLIGFFVLLTIVFFIGVFMGGKYIALLVEKNTLLAENENLRKQLSKVERIEYKLAKITEMEQYLRRILDENQEDKTEVIDEKKALEIAKIDFDANKISHVLKRSRYIPQGLPQSGAITTTYNYKNPLYKRKHEGIDIALPEGKAVYSTAAGKVIFADYTRDLGYLIVIDHTNGYTTRYGHLQKTTVEKDDFIDRNTIIGFSGSTGKSIGSHIHYEVLKDGKNINPLGDEEEPEGETESETEENIGQ
ncbi:MAG: peptidoglycan DD-metalloendopeptidase family protein [Candidatus Zixiibacteriota bacterium]